MLMGERHVVWPGSGQVLGEGDREIDELFRVGDDIEDRSTSTSGGGSGPTGEGPRKFQSGTAALSWLRLERGRRWQRSRNRGSGHTSRLVPRPEGKWQPLLLGRFEVDRRRSSTLGGAVGGTRHNL